MGGVVSGVSNLFSGGGNDAAADMEKSLRQAQDIMRQYYGEAKGYMQPFYDTGIQSMGKYSSRLDEMSDPLAFYQKMLTGYNTSPQAKFQQDQAMKASNQSAAAAGMLGGGAQQKALADYTQQLTSRDQQQWLNNMLGINSQYMGGESALMGQGFNAGQQIGNWGMQTGSDLASLMGAIGKAQAAGDVSNASGINKMIGALGGLLFGGSGGGSGGGSQMARGMSSGELSRYLPPGDFT